MSQPDTNSTEAQQAPACFGSPSCYATDSNICQACQGYNSCGEEAIKTLERIREVINIEDLLHKHNQAMTKKRKERQERNAQNAPPKSEKPTRATPKSVERKTKVEKIVYEIDEKTAELIATLPVKAQPFAVTLCKTGLIERIKKDMAKGVNPLEATGSKFLALGLKELLDGGFSRAGLREKYIETLGWTDSTAASHVSLVIKLFTMFDIAIENDSRIVANPTLMVDNSD